MRRPGRGVHRPEVPRAGVTLVEVAVSLAILLFLSVLLAGLLARAARQAARVSGRMEMVEARRITRDLVDHGVRAGGVIPGSGDRLRLRSYVGHAEACGPGVFLYRGRRRPDPDRDSVWILRDDGSHVVAAPGPVRRLPCPPGGTPSTSDGIVLPGLPAAPGGPAPVLLRFFEPGRYTLSDALRYGRRGSPAQPLTGPVLDPAGSTLRLTDRRVRVEVTGLADSLGVGRAWALPR